MKVIQKKDMKTKENLTLKNFTKEEEHEKTVELKEIIYALVRKPILVIQLCILISSKNIMER